MNRSVWLAVALLALQPAMVRGQDSTARGPLRFSGVELTVGGRLQSQFATTSVDSVPPSAMFIRRARLELSVRVNEWVSGTIHPDFGEEEVDLKDAYVRFASSPGFQVIAGKAYRPFGLLEQTSSKRMLPIERGLRVRGLAAADEYALTSGLGYSNRDIGVQVRGEPEGSSIDLNYGFGVFRGPLHGEVGNQDSYQFAARVTARPIESVRLGLGWSSRDFTDGVGAEPDLERGNAFEIDMEYGSFSPGFHLLAEVSRGDLDPFTDATFWGAHTWLAYRTGQVSRAVSAIEPVFRASHSETESDSGAAIVPGGTLLTPGINIYFGPLNRIMINYDHWLGADDSDDVSSFKAMFQLGF